jgi:hypothetical protein
VRARTKDLGFHKEGKILSSSEVLPWPIAADLASEQKGHDRGWRLLGLPGGTKRGRGGSPFIIRERGVAGFRVLGRNSQILPRLQFRVQDHLALKLLL